MLLLTRDEVMKVLDMSDCMDACEQAFAEMTSGTAILPLRAVKAILNGY